MNGHTFHGRGWIGLFVLVALIVAHAALFEFAFRGHISMALVAGTLGLVALKVMWWRRRR